MQPNKTSQLNLAPDLVTRCHLLSSEVKLADSMSVLNLKIEK